MLIKKRKIQKSIVENPKEGKGILSKWDYIKDQIPCSKIMTFSNLELEPGSHIGRHQHIDNFEVYCFIDGKGSVNDNGADCVVEPGDVLITGTGEYHSLTNTGEGVLRLIAFICST